METRSTTVSLAAALPAASPERSVRVDIARAPTQNAACESQDAPPQPLRCHDALALAMEHGAGGF